MIKNDILKFDSKYMEDESISSDQVYGYYPITGTQLNQPGSITITIQNGCNFYQPSESWLEFEGQLESATNVPFTKDSLISLANNGIMHLFDNIKYLLSSTEIESVFHPGHASTMIGMVTYPKPYAPGLNQCWEPDTSDTADDGNAGFKARRNMVITSQPTPLGSFRFAIPLKHIFGFCLDYKSVVYGFTHTIVLNRSSSDHNALFRKTDDPASNANVQDGKVTLKNLRWMIPRISPSDVAKYDLLKQIKSKIVLDVGFRMRQAITTSCPERTNMFTWRLGLRSSPEQPRYILLAFQTDRNEQQDQNIAVYDKCGITSAHILLNNDRYPLNSFEIDFDKNQFDHIYRDFSSFTEKFFKVDKIISSTGVDAMDYKSLYPILVFDVKNQHDRLKSGVTDITMKCTFKANIPPSTVAHAVIISDRKLKFKSDGEKLSVIY